MNHEDHVQLLRGGIPEPGGVWEREPGRVSSVIDTRAPSVAVTATVIKQPGYDTFRRHGVVR